MVTAPMRRLVGDRSNHIPDNGIWTKPVFAPEGRLVVATGETRGRKSRQSAAPAGRRIPSPLSGRSFIDNLESTGFASLHPWLHSSAPPGRNPMLVLHCLLAPNR